MISQVVDWYWWNGGMVEWSINGGVCGVVESLNRRIVEWWNGGAVELSNRRILSNCETAELSIRRIVKW